MKNLLLVLSVLFLFGLTSCSDVMDNSLPTSPVLEKNGMDDIYNPTSFPYPYLFNFNKIEDFKFLKLNIDVNATEFHLPSISQKYLHYYVVVNYINDKPASLYFIDKVNNGSFIIDGLNSSEVSDVNLYGCASRNDIASPFTNNTIMKEISSVWKSDEDNLIVEYTGTRPSSLKYVFAEIETKGNSQFVFLQKPIAQSFSIPGYGKGAVGLKLFGFHTLYDIVDAAK